MVDIATKGVDVATKGVGIATEVEELGTDDCDGTADVNDCA